MRSRRVWGGVSVVLLTFVSASAFAQDDDAGVQCRDLPSLFRVFTQQHYQVKRIDETIQAHTVDKFIDLLDPSHTVLLEAEVASFKQKLPGLFDQARQGDCHQLDEAWGVVTARAAEDLRLARDLVTPATYKLDDNAELIMDADKRPYAKDFAERSKRVRDLVHFQMSNYLTAGTSLEQAKKQLVHRYELLVKRIEGRKQKGALPGLWAQAFAEALDPHTAYMPPTELADFEIALKLSLEGIGAVLSSIDGFTTIQSIVPGGGAEKSGQLQTKDKIIAVAQEGEVPVPTIDMELTDVVKMIRGKKGTKVTLTVVRDGKQSKTFNVTIVRDKIDVSSQAAKITYQTRKLGTRTLKIGVIDLPSFYGGERGGRSSYEDMKKLLAEARGQKVDGIVLDLSRNGGGLLDDAVRIGGLFIKRGAVVGTRGNDGRLTVLDDTDSEVQWDGPLAVVISRASASASEIVAGALKDYRRALVIGSDKTFGKGTVQVVVPMPADIGAIRVTTGMFFLPGGDSTQLKGVQSDVQVPSVFDGMEIGEDRLEYALPAQSVSTFTSPSANGNGPEDHWDAVPGAMLASLAEKSRGRVAAEKGFNKIREQVAETLKNKGVVKLGELRRKAQKDATATGATDEDEKTDNMQKTVVNEGVNVLVDAIAAGLGREVVANQGRR
jgi:carboxyl-terminal processing protease